MINFKKICEKARAAKSGSTLYLVICISAVSVLLLTAVTTSVVSASSVSRRNVNVNQAYFTARSTVDATVSYLSKYYSTDPTGFDTLMKTSLIQSGTDSKLGDYTIKASYIDASGNVTSTASDRIKIVGTGTYPKATGVKKSTCAIINLSDFNNPFNYVFFMKNAVPTGHTVDTSVSDGSILCEGDMTLGSSDKILNASKVYASGSLTLGDGANATGDLYSDGNITLSGGGNVSGNLYAYGSYDFLHNIIDGNINFDGGAELQKNAYANGSISMPNGRVDKNAYAYKDVTMSCGGNIKGDANANGSISLTNGAKLDGNATYGTSLNYNHAADGSTISGTSALSPNSVTQNIPLDFEFKEKSLTSGFVNDFINSTSAVKVAWSSISCTTYDCGYKVYTIDNSSSDIFIDLNSDVNLSNATIKVTSSAHRVYFYLDGDNRQFSIGCNSRLGDQNSHIYFLGDGTSGQKISASSNSTLCAIIYAPDAAFTCSDAPYTSPGLSGYESQGILDNVPILEGDGAIHTDVKFYGSAIVSTKAKAADGTFTGVDSNAASNTNIAYNKSVVANVPSYLMNLASGNTGGGGSGGSWSNPKWSDS